MKEINKTIPDKIEKIIHISDIHIRQYKRYDEYESVFDNLYKEIQYILSKYKCICIVTGDLVHSKTDISPELIIMTSNFLKSLQALVYTIVIPGNHDANLFNSNRVDTLTPIIDLLQCDNLYYMKNNGLFTINNICFSHMSVFSEMNQYKLANEIDDKYYKIALFHGAVNGSKSENYTLSGKISVDFFNGFDFVMLGDIHLQQTLQKYNKKKRLPEIQYAGSLICQNYGEHPTNHGILVWDLETRTPEFVKIQNDYGYYTIEIDSSLKIPEVQLSKFPRIRVKFSNVDIKNIDSTIKKIKEKYKPVDLIFVRDNLIKSNSKDDVQYKDFKNISSLEIQLKLIDSYIDEHFSISADRKVEILELHKAVYDINKTVDVSSSQAIWKLNKLTWSNLFSFAENNSIDFSKLDGIVGIFGPNALGKSSIAEILSFALFDKTSKEFKTISIVNNRKKNFLCEVEFENNASYYKLRKVGKKNKQGNKITVEVELFEKNKFDDTGWISINEENKWETNKTIKSILGEFSDFLLTTYSVQNDNLGFINKSNTDKKDLLLKFLDIKIFELLYNTANERLKELNIILKQYNGDQLHQLIETNKANIFTYSKEIKKEKHVISYTENDIEKLQVKLNTAHSKLISINDSLNFDLTSKENEKEKLKKEIANDENQIVVFKEKDSEIDVKLEKVEQYISNKDEINKKYKEYSDVMLKKKMLQERIQIEDDLLKKAQKSMSLLKDVEYDKNCSFCVTNIGKTKEERIENVRIHFEAHRMLSEEYNEIVLDTKIKKLKENLDRAISEKSILLEDRNRFINAIELLKKRNAEKEIKINQIDELISDYHSNIKAITHNTKVQTQITEIKSKIDGLTKDLSGFRKNLSSAEVGLGVSQSNLEQYTQKKDELDAYINEKENYAIYCNIMKRDELPFSLIIKTIPFLETEINNILQQIVSFSILFNIDENKNLDIFIIYDDQRYWSLDLASGMEKFIVSLAFRVALTDMSNLSKSNFLIIDEGWGNLHSDNLSSVSNLLDFLKQQYKFILIVSHIDSIKDTADTLLEIKKENDFSHIRYE